MGNVPRGTSPEDSRSSKGLKWNTSRKESNPALKSMKFSTEEQIYRSCPRRGMTSSKALPPHTFAPRTKAPPTGAFHRFAPFSTCQLPTFKSLSPFNLECHEQDSRHCQPKGWSWQNHYSYQSVCLPCPRGPQDPPCRLRSPSQRYIRHRIPAGR